MNKNDYFLYNSSIHSAINGGSESPLAMIQFINSALKQQQQQQQQQQQKKKQPINPHRPVSMYSVQNQRPMGQQQQQQHHLYNQNVMNLKPQLKNATTINNNMVKSTAHTSIQKLVKLDTDLLTPTSSSSNYLIKYPVQESTPVLKTPPSNNETNIYDEIDYSNAPMINTMLQHQPSHQHAAQSGTKLIRLRNLSAKINCCFKSAQSSAAQCQPQSSWRRRRSDDARSISSSTRHLNSSGSSSSSGISIGSNSSASSTSSTDNNNRHKQYQHNQLPQQQQQSQRYNGGFVTGIRTTTTANNRSPTITSGYTSGHDLSNSSSLSNNSCYRNNQQKQHHITTGSFKSTTTTTPKMGTQLNHSSSSASSAAKRSQIESLKRMQELELLKFNQKQALLLQQQQQEHDSADEYNYESMLARKLEKSSLTNVDSGISTLGGCNGRDIDSTASDATSNLSSYMSSSPLFSSSSSSSSSAANSSSASLVEWSPFPKVKTCLIAQVKPLKQNTKATSNEEEPIYENLNKYEHLTNAKPHKQQQQQTKQVKQYSVKDVFSSLKSLELESHEEDDLLCDREVDFYLNRSQFAQYFNFSNYVNQHQLQHHHQQQQQHHNHHKLNNCKPTITKSSSKPVALWEQLV